MRIGSKEWLEWRRSHITATDLPVIMGKSKWKTLEQLYLEKTEGSPEKESNAWMERGKLLEPQALDKFLELTGICLEPKIVEHPLHTWAAATLDGWNEQGVIAEVKCPGKVDSMKALEGKVPSHYIHQLQWQMFVTGSSCMWYINYNPEFVDPIIFFEVQRDEEIIQEMVKKAEEFYKSVKQQNPPLTSHEEVNLQDFYNLEGRFKQLKLQEKQIVEELELLRKEMSKVASGNTVVGKYVKYTRQEILGPIEYKNIPELAGVNLDQYRKSPVIRERFDLI